MSPIPSYISVEGNIGTGKSTMLRLLSQWFPEESMVRTVQEPVDKWTGLCDSAGENILNKFYRDQEKWSYAFQVMAFMTRLRDLQVVSAECPWRKWIVISERCLYTDRHVFARQLFSDGKMSELEWKLYCDWFDWLTGPDGIPSDFKRPVFHIYMRASPTTCAARIRKRSRTEESTVPLEYLEKIHQRHDEWLLGKDNVLIIDCDKDFENDPEYLEEVRHRICIGLYNATEPRPSYVVTNNADTS